MSRVSDTAHSKIMAAAKELVAKRGSSSVTVADVTRAAGVSKATIYRDSRFQEWWNATRLSEEPINCPQCEDLAWFQKRVKEQKAEIQVLEESLAKTTAALAALASQLTSENAPRTLLTLQRTESPGQFDNER